MTTGFEVRPPVLTGEAARLARLADEVRQMVARSTGSVCVDTGDPTLTAALTKFTGYWVQTTQALATGLAQAAERVERAATLYVGVDGSVMPTCTPGPD